LTVENQRIKYQYITAICAGLIIGCILGMYVVTIGYLYWRDACWIAEEHPEANYLEQKPNCEGILWHKHLMIDPLLNLTK